MLKRGKFGMNLYKIILLLYNCLIDHVFDLPFILFIGLSVSNIR